MHDVYAQNVHFLGFRRHLDKAIHNAEEDVRRACDALRAYESVDSGFDDLVKEFTALQAEVENKRWALRELNIHREENTSLLAAGNG